MNIIKKSITVLIVKKQNRLKHKILITNILTRNKRNTLNKLRSKRFIVNFEASQMEFVIGKCRID